MGSVKSVAFKQHIETFHLNESNDTIRVKSKRVSGFPHGSKRRQIVDDEGQWNCNRKRLARCQLGTSPNITNQKTETLTTMNPIRRSAFIIYNDIFC